MLGNPVNVGDLEYRWHQRAPHRESDDRGRDERDKTGRAWLARLKTARARPPGSKWVPPFKLAGALMSAARHPELVLLRIISRVDDVHSISIKDERRTNR